MSTSARPSRRALLGGAALAAGALALQACSPDETKTGSNGTKPKANPAGKGSETKPLPVPKKLGESPDLAAQVKAGKLPAVADRLPQQPYVVPHRWLAPGKYGGELNLP